MPARQLPGRAFQKLAKVQDFGGIAHALVDIEFLRAGLRGVPGRSAYGASKAGLIMLAKVMAVEADGPLMSMTWTASP